MKNHVIAFITGAVLAGLAGAAENPLPAFPGAEGWGCETPGGRGGKVYVVTNLNPDGPGSLQEACEAKGPRIVVFAVSGVIRNTITIEDSNITIAGQSAPGGGITIEGMLVSKSGLRDIVVRFVRVRPRPAEEQIVPDQEGGGPLATRLRKIGVELKNPHENWFAEYDAIKFSGLTNVVLDHVSASWSHDELIEFCGTHHNTVQWCTLEEACLGKHQKYRGYHNFGPFSGYNKEGDFVSFHHNLFAHLSRRNPTARDGFADIRNNMVYNFRGGINFDGSCEKTATSKDYNYVGNTFKTGPNSRGVLPGVSWGNNKLWWAEFRDEPRDNEGTSKFFVEDNLLDGQPAPLPEIITSGKVRLKEPMPSPKVTTQSATKAYELVLKQAGAFPRDAVTRRTIEEVRTGTGSWGRHDPKGGLMEGLKPSDAPLDTDHDGMPDEWEKKNGLDPAKDDSAKIQTDGYTAIEYYLNQRAVELVATD